MDITWISKASAAELAENRHDPFAKQEDVREDEVLADGIWDEIPASNQAYMPPVSRHAAKPVLEQALDRRGVRGDDLLDSLDLADELTDVGAEISPTGVVTIYHRTNLENALEIARTSQMTSREDRVFFGTRPSGQIDGYGDAVVRVRIPLERLELNDVFPDEAHVTVRSGRPGTPLPVRAEVVTASRTRTASWWSRDMLDHKLARLDMEERDARLFRALCEIFLNSTDADYLQDMCFWAASFLGAACDEIGIPLEVSLGSYSPEGEGFDHAWLVDASGTPFDITAVAHAAHRMETRSGDMVGVAAFCPDCGQMTDSGWGRGECECEDPPEPVERTRRFSDEDEMMDAGYECVERDQYPEWKAEFVEPERYSGESGAAAAARTADMVGFDDDEERTAREMARSVLSAKGRAARRAAISVESEIKAIAADTRRRLGVDHELEDGEAPKALCLDFARELADELARRGYSAGVTQGTFEVDWPDEEAYDEWNPDDFEADGSEDEEDAMSAEDMMGQAMHFPLHYWVRVTAKDGKPVPPVFVDITADQFDDESDESFDPVWIWTGDTDRHQPQRHDFIGAVFPQASRYHRAHRVIAADTVHVYHGTSLSQLESIRDLGWQVRGIYLADYREKSEDYAERKAAAESEDAVPVVLQLDMDALRRLGQIEVDLGTGPEEWERDMGQFVYSGPLRAAITNLGEVIREIRDEWGEEFTP